MGRTLRDYNFVLLACMLVLLGFSLALVYSSTLSDPFTQGYFSRHLINIIVGMVAMFLLTGLDYHALQAWTIPLYISTVGILAFVLAMGMVSSGAQSWLNLGLRTFQPSEPAKLIVIMSLAAYWQRFDHRSGDAWVQFGGLILAGIPLGLVFLQPDFGTAMVFTSAWFMIAWVAGMRLWQLITLIVVAIPTAYIGWNYVLHDYQQLRLKIFIDPIGYDPDLQYGAWHIIQSLTAISGGGLTGHGWTHGILTQNNYLPVQYSDFIFAVAGEELGFIGSAVLLVFQLLLLWQAITIAGQARDTYGRLIAVGISAMFICHLLVNVGMTMSIMPITGIPLQFVSYGGSFTLTTFAAIGLLQSISLRQRALPL
jgi:rod shape determining protein RodA